MSQTVYIDRHLVFKTDASHKPNITGNPSTERMCSVDWFDGKAIDLVNDYTSTLGGGSDAVALEAAGRNGVKLTTSTSNLLVSFLATNLIFGITQEPEIEARIKIVDVSGTLVYFGFGDATSESTPEATIDAFGGTITKGSNTADAVGFVIDAEKGSSSIYCASTKTSAAIQSVDTGLAYTNDQTKNLRIRLDSSGNARFYVDGAEVGYIASAVADVSLCAIFNYGTRAADGANIVNVRYLKRWQDTV